MQTATASEPVDSIRSSDITAPGSIHFRGYIRELDGLRAVGLLLVLTDHFLPQGFSYLLFQLGNLGWIAIDSFFVMSGLLITGILLDTRERPNYFSTYYARRALRILPLYYAVLLAWYAIIRFTNHGIDYANMIQYWGSPAWLTFYAGNIRQAIVGMPTVNLGYTLVLAYAPLWSLQVEEQFYLIFPLAVAFLNPRRLRLFLIAGIVCSPLLRLLGYLWHPGNPFLQYTQLPTHCEGIALGGLIALRLRSGPWKVSRALLTALTALFLGGACAGSVLSTWGTYDQAWSTVWNRLVGYSISAAGCACLILWLLCFRESVYTAWLRVAPLRYLGKISYGVYLLHPLALWMVLELGKKGFIHFHQNDWRYVILAVVSSVALASISWKFFETPLLRIKDRIRYDRSKPMLTESAEVSA